MFLRSLAVFFLLTTNTFATEWKVQADSSTLTFEGTQAGTPFQGSFATFTADITLDPDNLAAASIKVDILTASAATGSSERDEALPGSDWFDVANHPIATFASTNISQTAEGYVADGTLTLKGTTQPVSLPFILSIDGDKAEAAGGLTINRNDYGVGTGPLSPMAGNDVGIKFEITATR